MPQSKIVITDSSCFILLHKINALHLLSALFANVFTTPEVAKECGVSLPDWVEIRSVTNEILKEEFLNYVDLGEASAIALSFEISADYLIIDDLKGRKLVKKLGLPLKSTVGLLLDAKTQGIIATVKPYIELIKQTNFRLSDNFIADFLESADE